MATRTFQEKHFAILKREVRLYGTFSVGAAGAVTLQKWNYPVFGGGPSARTYTAAAITGGGTAWPQTAQQGSEGIFSVTRTGAGLWTVRLQDNYQRMVGLYGYISVAAGASNIVTIAENSTISNMTSTGGSLIGVALLSSTATVADPTSGHIVNLTFVLGDATEP